MSYGGYNAQRNPYAQGSQNPFEEEADVEMQSFNNNSDSNPHAILASCRNIVQRTREIETNNFAQVRALQGRILNSSDEQLGGQLTQQRDDLMKKTMEQYGALGQLLREVKSMPGANSTRNASQVQHAQDVLQRAMPEFRKLDSEFRRQMQGQMARQYRIVCPQATEEEARDAVEDPSGSVFTQALLQTNRRGESQAVLNRVKARHEQLLGIERQMEELAQLFQQLDTIVVQQEEAITQIEQKGEETVENLDQGNKQIHIAVDTARKTRRKKCICLGIIVAILVIIGIVLAIYFTVGRNNNNSNSNSNSNNNSNNSNNARRALTWQ